MCCGGVCVYVVGVGTGVEFMSFVLYVDMLLALSMSIVRLTCECCLSI